MPRICSLSNDALTDALSQVEGMITKRGGSIDKRIDRGRKALGYAMKKKTDGFVYTIDFLLDPTHVQDIDYELKLFNTLLKYTIFRQDEGARQSDAQDTAGATKETTLDQ